jgi:beta-lactam-binding protein with PASTA domain
VMLMAITVGTVGWWLGSGRWTDVPSLVGKDREAAIDLLQAAGLDPNPVREAWSETVPEGVVISADPADGEAIRGTDIAVVVSKGPERFVVPVELAGQEVTAVVAQLQDTLPLQVTTEDQYSNDVEAGLVIGFDPPAGTELKRDALVTVLVSQGHEPVAVPDVLGQTPEAATANLQQLGFTVNRVEDGRSADVDKGEVMAVDPGPAAGPVAYASTINIQVSAGMPQVKVPDVQGRSSAEARQILEAAGLKVETSSWITGDRVVGQTPKAGETVDQGTTVKILLSFW